MNKFYCLFFLMTSFYACKNEKKIHEEAITTFIQNDRKAVWPNLKLQIIEMSAPYYITVEDCLKILNQEFEAQQKVEIEKIKYRLSDYKLKIEKEEFKLIDKKNEESLLNDQRRLDSLERLVYTTPENYMNKKGSAVIAIKIECTFLIRQPDIRQEMKETFILNAEGDKCLRYLQHKSN